MIADTDLQGCFTTADFGQTVILRQKNTGESREITAWFSEGSDKVEMYDVEIEAVEPNLIALTSDLEDITRNWLVDLDGRIFNIERIQRVGTGVSVAYLKASSGGCK